VGRKITVTLAASIKDTHKTVSKTPKPLILLTFSLWHLNWLYNTTKNALLSTDKGAFFE